MTPCVAGMGKEEDPAMPASGQAGPQARLGLQDGSQDNVELKDKTGHIVQAVPSQAELKMLLDFYDKKPRVSLTILVYCCMSLSYQTALTSVER